MFLTCPKFLSVFCSCTALHLVHSTRFDTLNIGRKRQQQTKHNACQVVIVNAKSFFENAFSYAWTWFSHLYSKCQIDSNIVLDELLILFLIHEEWPENKHHRVDKAFWSNKGHQYVNIRCITNTCKKESHNLKQGIRQQYGYFCKN